VKAAPIVAPQLEPEFEVRTDKNTYTIPDNGMISLLTDI
jgi:hypothetical protein